MLTLALHLLGLAGISTALLESDSNAEILNIAGISFANPVGIWLGVVMLYGTPIYLWQFHPRFVKLVRNHTEGENE